MTNHQVSELLAPIKAWTDAATEGPWEIDSIESGEHGVFAEEHHRLGCGTSQVAGFMTKANAEFLIHARTDVPRLIQALEAVEEQAWACVELADITPNETAAEALRLAARGIRGAVADALRGVE